MTNSLKVCVVPLDTTPVDVSANLSSTAYALNEVESDTDLVVLPELFTTGFTADKTLCKSLAETSGGKTMDAVRRWAQYFGFAIAGSFMAQENGKIFNRAFFAEPSGDMTFYDKRHLFPLSKEHEVFSSGTSLSPLVRYRGWNIKTVVCYDLRFPVWCRNTEPYYDLLVAPSIWPHTRIFQYHQLLSTRALENQAYTIGANRTGTDDSGEYPCGDSAIFNNLGKRIEETRRNGLIYSVLDIEALRKGRDRFPALRDSDDFLITL